MHRPHLPGALRGGLHAGHSTPTPVGIKSLERAIIDKAGENGWVAAAAGREVKTGRKVAIVGSGPAGLAGAAATGARRPRRHGVREERPHSAACLRYGIPDFKLDKRLIDWRIAQMAG
jgi:glutamate synthase (NADPH/NADH) small chain